METSTFSLGCQYLVKQNKPDIFFKNDNMHYAYVLCSVVRISADQTGGVHTFTQPVTGFMYTVVGIGKAVDYFSVHSSTGVVTISKPLTEDDSNFYSLKVRWHHGKVAWPSLSNSNG